MRIIDSHCHLGPYFNHHLSNPSPEGMMISMDNIGIEKAFITPHMTLSSDIKRGNELMLDTVNRYPDRFLGYFTYNPHFPELMESMIPAYFKNPAVMGIKLHQGLHKTTLKNLSYRYIFSYANEHRLPLLIHTWEMGTILNIEEISSEYPDAIFIMGHFGAVPDNMKYAAGVVKSRKNVLGDTTVSMLYERNIEWLIEIAGDDKIIFGTDMPFYDPRANLGRILNSGLTGVSKEKILGQNILRILENVKKHEDS